MMPRNVLPLATTPECVCPQCGALLQTVKQKLVCPRCGIVEGCCEGGKQ